MAAVGAKSLNKNRVISDHGNGNLKKKYGYCFWIRYNHMMAARRDVYGGHAYLPARSLFGYQARPAASHLEPAVFSQFGRRCSALFPIH
jgi:hypothetical protein